MANRTSTMALMKRNTAQYPVGVDWNLRPRQSVKLACQWPSVQPVWSPSLCAGGLRRHSDVVSPGTHNLLISNSKCLKHRGIWTFHSRAEYATSKWIFTLGFLKWEKFQLFLTGVPFGVSALQSSWRGTDCNVSRVAFASESCMRGWFWKHYSGCRIEQRVITEGKNNQKHIVNTLSDLGLESHTVKWGEDK